MAEIDGKMPDAGDRAVGEGRRRRLEARPPVGPHNFLEGWRRG